MSDWTPNWAIVQPAEQELMTTSGEQTRFVRQVDFGRFRQVVLVAASPLTARAFADRYDMGDDVIQIPVGNIYLYVVASPDLRSR